MLFAATVYNNNSLGRYSTTCLESPPEYEPRPQGIINCTNGAGNMPKFSKTSKQRLATCHQDLQTLFNQVINHFDCTILCGHRGEKEQNEHYASGRSKVKWPNGKHNKTPSMAVDAAPYPIDWKDRERMILFAGYVMGVAQVLHDEGMIAHRLRWGGDWDRDTEVADNGFDDLVHFELVE